MKRRERIRRITILVVAIVIVVSLVIGLYLAFNTSSPNSAYVGKQISTSVLNALAGVSDSTLSTIGVPTGVIAPNAITGSPLTLNGKPLILYIGGDYCPYCAVERWSLIMALSRFGQFSNLTYMLSSSTDVNPNSPTFSFESASYTSNYISFVGVEEFGQDPSVVRQPLTSQQQSLVSQYDTCPSTGGSGGIPFVDIGNSYAVNCGAQSNLDIEGQNWTQIASQLNNPSSNTARLIDGAANTMITAICHLSSVVAKGPAVCNQPYATEAASYVGSGSSGFATSLVLVPSFRQGPTWPV
jgi:hypothetical protein